MINDNRKNNRKPYTIQTAIKYQILGKLIVNVDDIKNMSTTESCSVLMITKVDKFGVYCDINNNMHISFDNLFESYVFYPSEDACGVMANIITYKIDENGNFVIDKIQEI